jgi:hypothetical protein
MQATLFVTGLRYRVRPRNSNTSFASPGIHNPPSSIAKHPLEVGLRICPSKCSHQAAEAATVVLVTSHIEATPHAEADEAGAKTTRFRDYRHHRLVQS